MSNQASRPRDPMITFRSTTRKKNSKGGDWLQLYMNSDQVAALANTLATKLDNERGVRIDFHTSKKENRNTGTTFDSTICYVKAVEDRDASAIKMTTSDETAARIKKLKEEVV